MQEREEETVIIQSLSKSRANEVANTLKHIYTDIVFSVHEKWGMGHEIKATGSIEAILEEVKGTAEHLAALKDEK